MLFLFDRRTFLKQVGLFSAGVLSGVNSLSSASFQRRLSNGDQIDDFIMERMALYHIPGVAASVVKGDRVVWSRGYGYAELTSERPMSPTDSVQNIGSVSKTIVATAVMQLWEQQKIRLEADINDYLPFPVRNPGHPAQSITPYHLLIHRSSIKDGPAYGRSYACGDPQESLGDWLRNYLCPSGRYYEGAENFHPWPPGTEEQFSFPPPNYTNVGFGLLAFLVESVSGMSFDTYCRKYIFDPLEMEHSSWFIRDIDRAKHVIPYDYLPPDFQLPPGLSYRQLLPQKSETETPLTPETYFPHCLYGFPNYPDGLLRTSAVELSHLLIAYLNEGVYGQQRLLEAATIDRMLQPQLATDPMQGLCWQRIQVAENDFVWGHSGGDPGINTFVMMDPPSRKGAVLLTNSSQSNIFELVYTLFGQEW